MKYYNKKQSFSKFNFINDDYKYFFNTNENLKFYSSFFVTRCTEPNKEKTDERLTTIDKQGKVLVYLQENGLALLKVLKNY